MLKKRKILQAERNLLGKIKAMTDIIYIMGFKVVILC